ncbi:hypothetical protein ACJMK2_035889 [Sinanodonta woodiana]|uniref:Uncharacterized protein n=1 Tax=Sinanodonta woodiana TaxID=1069815 RepID=A0ABD3WIU9_SINWO
MLDAYNKEEAEYNNAVKNKDELHSRAQQLQEEIEKQNKRIQQLQEIVNLNNETINSLKKIKNFSILDLVKDQIKDVEDAILNKVKDDKVENLDNVLGKLQSNSIKEDEIRANKTKFDSNWDPQFPE